MRLALTIGLGLATLSCASEPEERDGSTAGQTAAGQTAAPSPSPEPTEPADQDDLADGRHTVYLKSVDTEARSIIVDVVQFLIGDEANDAYYKETGDREGAPNDYFIKNENDKLRTFEVDEDAGIEVTAFDGDAVDLDPVSFEQLAEYVNDIEGSRPFWLEIEGGTVADIQEQYVP